MGRRTPGGKGHLLRLVWCFGFLGVAMCSRASELKPDERVILYPALAAPTAKGWELDLHGMVFEPESRRLTIGTLRKVLGIDEESLTPAEVAIFNERCRQFLVDHERGKKLAATLRGQPIAFGASAADGHFRARHLWKTNIAPVVLTKTGGVLATSVAIGGGQSRIVPIEIHFLDSPGVSIVSDIDDTIKVSEVLDKTALLKNTFCRPFKPVDGMADLYRRWEAEHGASFHYVTASPWQLYVPLSGFTRSNGFPAGTWHMKDFRVKDRSALDLLTSPERYKPGVIEPLLRKFPKRRFVLVGDSGEKDPEIYGALARKFPAQVHRILIRDATGEAAESARYAKAFVRLPRERWQIFKEPREIQDTLSRAP